MAKDNVIKVRVTEKQKNELEKIAKDNEMNVSEFIRYILKKEGAI